MLWAFGALLEFLLFIAACVGAVWAYRSRWRESDWFGGLACGLLLVTGCIANEALLGLLPFAPLWWAILYFPLRTVGIPFAAILTVAFSVGRVLRGPALPHRLASLLSVALALGVIWFCWQSRDMLFFHVPDRLRGTG